MISDLIVGSSLLLALMFILGWALSPGLRTWIERPKYRFQDALRDYDRSQHQPRSPS